MDFSEFTLGWREGLLALIVFLALYIVLVLWRIRRLRQQKKRAEATTPPALEPVLKALSENATPVSSGELKDKRNDVAWQEPPTHLGEEVFMQGVENELAQMREELDALRGEFAALRESVQRDVGHMQASQSVSPLYSDAMQMAMTGYGAEVIAQRCGISRAEAELVASLVKNRER